MNLKQNYMFLIAIGYLAITLSVWFFKHYRFGINVSTSLPQKLWVTNLDDKTFKVGDYIMVKFHDYRMLKPQDFEYVVKQVGGIAGDKIVVKKQNNNLAYELPDGTYQVHKTLSGFNFNPLTANDLTIPEGCYFIHGQHHPSFDSRYKEFGLICQKQIYGKAYPIF